MTASSRDLRATVLRDLDAESQQLQSWVEGAPEAWTRPSPAEGWTVAHQVAHLAWTDHVSLLAGRNSPAFGRELERFAELEDAYSDFTTASLAQLPRPQLLARWSAQRVELRDWLRQLGDDVRIPWFGPSMGPTSMATARFMETWAHGGDIAAALDVAYPRRDSVRHVAEIGVRTRDHSFRTHRLPIPTVPCRVELTSPSGQLWTWGPDDAANRIRGDAFDFALLVTRRRHRDDVDVTPRGPVAERWLTIAQAFAGTPGPNPRRRRRGSATPSRRPQRTKNVTAG